MTPPKIVFVGLGPNQACWERGLALGQKIKPDDPEGFAARYSYRLRLTGALGRKMASLLGMEFREWLCKYERRNLNGRWNGKEGKGDKFDRQTGLLCAQGIEAEGFDRFVLLGGEAARSFGFQGEPLSIKNRRYDFKKFLLFPHPSGINTFWNEEFNRFRAARVLKDFVLSP